MKDLQIFSNEEFGSIRTVVIDGDPWFVAVDVCAALGIVNSRNAMARLDEDEKGVRSMDIVDSDSIVVSRELSIVNEPGLYALAIGSKKPSAKKFKRWITHDVIPSIRKTGSYSMPMTTSDQIRLLAQGHTELSERVDRIEDGLEEFKRTLPVQPEDAERISNAVKRKGVVLMGGKDAPAYRDAGIRMKVYKDIYGQLKRNFDVSSYKNIKRLECDRALEVIERYQLPVYLADIIADANAQQRLNLEIETKGGQES